MKNLTLAIGLIAVIVFAGAYLYFEVNDQPYSPQSSGTDSSSGNYQKVVLSFKNYNYYPNTVTVKSGEPVRIYLDSSVSGCGRSFVIRQLGVSKYLATPQDYVEFTPTTPGKYIFSCSMGMYKGFLVVE